MESCEYLNWDSEFFGVRIARFQASLLTIETGTQAISWCGGNDIECLYFLADSNDPGTISAAEQLGFRLVDIRVTFEQTLEGLAPDPGAWGMVRAARPEDLGRLIPIARSSHRDTRFYADPGFPDSRCDDLYAAWIERSCKGGADAVFVADAGGVPGGYISCHLSESHVGSIGLIAVRPGARRAGLGRQLVCASLDYMRRSQMTSSVVVTQGRNYSSQRLYQTCGFRTKTVQLWYHRWFS